MKEAKLILDGMTVKDLQALISETVVGTIKKELKALAPESGHDEYLTKEQVKRRLKCSLSTVNKYMKEGIIPSYTVSGKVLFKSKDVENVLRQLPSIKYKHRA